MMLPMVADASAVGQDEPAAVLRRTTGAAQRLGLAILASTALLPACAPSLPAAEPVLPQDLVGFWRFDEGAGTTAADASRYGNHGALLGAPPSAPGRIGGARLFDHVGAAVQIPPKAVLHSARALTISAWVNASSLEAARTSRERSWHTILSKADPPGSATLGTSDSWEYSVFVSPAGALNAAVTTVDQVGKGPQYCATADGTIQIGRWQHVGVVLDCDGALARVFVDGVLAARCPIDRSGIRETTGHFTIGADDVGSDYRWQGLLDEIRVYSRALREDEIRALAGLSH
jgi:hypothetical protein